IALTTFHHCAVLQNAGVTIPARKAAEFNFSFRAYDVCQTCQSPIAADGRLKSSPPLRVQRVFEGKRIVITGGSIENGLACAVPILKRVQPRRVEEDLRLLLFQ